jgi:TrpR-related protein YerC/YecD
VTATRSSSTTSTRAHGVHRRVRSTPDDRATRCRSPSTRKPLIRFATYNRGQGQRTVEQRAADDRSLATDRGDRGEVGLGADSACSEQRQTRGVADLAQEIEIRSTEHPVALDRRAQDPRHAGRRATPSDFGRVYAGVLEPPTSCDVTATNVDRDDEPVTELRGESVERFWLRERGGPDNDARGASAEELLGVGQGADPAGSLQLRGSGRLGETGDNVWPDPAAAGAVQVDDVNQSGPRGRESPHQLLRLRPRRDAAEVSLLEPYGILAEQVDSGKHLEGLFCHVSMLIQHSIRAGEITAVAEGSHPEWETKETRDLLKTIVSLRTVDEAERFLRDLCTLSELEAMTHRWQAAQLVDRGMPYHEVSKRTGASTTTVTRVAHWLRHGEGGYRLMLDRRQRRPARTA